jgi:hypothetical protein
MNARIAFAEIAYEERFAKDTETSGRKGDAPRRVERSSVDSAEGPIEGAIEIKPPDVAITDALFVETRHGIDFSVGDVKLALDLLNVERSESGRDGCVDEGKRGFSLEGEVAVKNVNVVVRKVGGVEKIAGC